MILNTYQNQQFQDSNQYKSMNSFEMKPGSVENSIGVFSGMKAQLNQRQHRR